MVVETPLAPEDGVVVAPSIELAVLEGSLSRVSSNGIQLDAQVVHLGADLESAGSSIQFGGDVVLQNDVTLIAADVEFLGSVDDDGNPATSSSLNILSTGTTRFAQDVGRTSPLDPAINR